MSKKLLLSSILFFAFSSTVAAKDCGEPPVDIPHIPNGARSSAEDMRIARDAVVTYSGMVDTYITCMDDKALKLFTYMTEEQRDRWTNDLADIHDTRRELQQNMNVQIRAFRNAQRNSGK